MIKRHAQQMAAEVMANGVHFFQAEVVEQQHEISCLCLELVRCYRGGLVSSALPE